jgi:hypothetical protein
MVCDETRAARLRVNALPVAPEIGFLSDLLRMIRDARNGEVPVADDHDSFAMNYCESNGFHVVDTLRDSLKDSAR